MTVRAYVRRIWGLRGAFRRVFLGLDGKPTADGEVVLAELRRFCYGGKPTIKAGPNGVDPYASIAAAARQEVFMRITSMLLLDDRDIARMEELAQEKDNG